jgi:Fe-S-cluster containining protein
MAPLKNTPASNVHVVSMGTGLKEVKDNRSVMGTRRPGAAILPHAVRLHVIQPEPGIAPAPSPWYAGGLRFTCTQCGNCCTGSPGHVWISIEEITRLAAHLKILPEQVVERYCRKVNGRFSLRERRNLRGEYDCIFLQERRIERRGGDAPDSRVVHSQRICTIYEARPLQCRTWPFWSDNLKTQAAWERAARRCPGMNSGQHYTRPRIEALRDATDWPTRPPGSAASAPARSPARR